MKKEQIQVEQFETFEAVQYDLNGVECWSARELQNILGYSQWRNFKKIIIKASDACEKSGNAVHGHFVGISWSL